MKIREDIGQQNIMAFNIEGDGVLYYQGRFCVPDIDRLWERI